MMKEFIEPLAYRKPMITQGKREEKGWGHELHIQNTKDYCGKLLVFRKGAQFSMHYHMNKYETWYIQEGKLKFRWIDPENADVVQEVLDKGDIVTLYQGIPHQLEAVEDSVVFEISTEDNRLDNYRVSKGDSQKGARNV